MSSSEDEFIASMRESGKMEKLLAAAGLGQPAAEAPAVEETDDTATAPEVDAPAVEETDDTVVAPEDEEVVDASEEDPDATAIEEDELFLDLDPETEEFLAKYGGDLNAALAAARSAQSKIGEQGNTLGELRDQIARLEAGLTAGAYEPYEWPDLEEGFEPMEAVSGLHRVAEQAYARQDVQSFEAALAYMNQIDPIRTQMYAQAKAAEFATTEAAQSRDPSAELATAVADFKTAHPDIEKPEVQAALKAELERFPSLAGIIQNPNGDPGERMRVLGEMYDRVASRQTADTVRQSARRVAVRTSEEARDARAAARVATADQRGAATTTEDKPDTVIRMRTAEGDSQFNVTELHRQTAALADGTPEMVLRNGRMYVRQPDGSLVPRAD